MAGEAALVAELGAHFKHNVVTPAFVGERSEGHMKGMSKLRASTQEWQEVT